MDKFFVSFFILCIYLIIPIFSLDQCEVSPVNVKRPGETVTFTCSTINSNSTIVFRKNGQKMIITSESQMGNRRIYQVRRDVQEDDNFAIFKCSERFHNTLEKNECPLKTPLEIPAKVNIDPPYQIVTVGEDAMFTCQGQAVPDVTYYNWWVEKENIDLLSSDRFVEEDGGRILRIRNVTEDLNQCEIKCRVGNIVDDKRSKANAKSLLLIEGMPMPENMTFSVTTISPRVESSKETLPQSGLFEENVYFIIGVAGIVVLSVIFVCSLCIIKMKKDQQKERKKSVSKTPTEKFDDVERARPNSYSELPKNKGTTIEPVTQWKVVTMDSFTEEPDFGPAKLYPDLNEEEVNIYENMDSLGNAKGPANQYSGYASMASVQNNV